MSWSWRSIRPALTSSSDSDSDGDGDDGRRPTWRQLEKQFRAAEQLKTKDPPHHQQWNQPTRDDPRPSCPKRGRWMEPDPVYPCFIRSAAGDSRQELTRNGGWEAGLWRGIVWAIKCLSPVVELNQRIWSHGHIRGLACWCWGSKFGGPKDVW